MLKQILSKSTKFAKDVWKSGKPAVGANMARNRATQQITQNSLNNVINGNFKNASVQKNANAMRSYFNGQSGSANTGSALLGNVMKPSKSSAANTLINSTTSLTTQFAVGATAMTAVSMMRGGMQQANAAMMKKYMTDTRFSSKMLNAKVGSTRPDSRLNIGNHTGLSLSLSRGRHG